MSFHILLLEDDSALARLTKEFLQQEGFVVSCANQAHRAKLLLEQQQIDLLICDVMLPGVNGFDFVEAIRDQYQGPILFMTAQTQLQHQLKGFALGAQDYLVKPVDPRLLLAKIQVFLPKTPSSVSPVTALNFHNLKLDLQSRTASIDGNTLQLTSAEYKLLKALCEKFGKVVSRDWLFQQHLGRDYDGMDRTMDGRASRLRKKLQTIDAAWNVVTAWGEGYYLSYGSAEPL